jgi:hypothetical protein
MRRRSPAKAWLSSSAEWWQERRMFFSPLFSKIALFSVVD